MSAGDGEVAATVDGEPVSAAEVAAEVARLRAGPLGARLPPDGTPEGRQLRRWTTQRVVLRRLLEREAAGRDLATADRPSRPVRADPALLGAAVADVLVTSPAAQAVYAAVAAAETAPEAAVREHYDRNRDRYPLPYPAVRDRIAAELLDRRRQLAFARWLDARAAALILLRPGYEHPADPTNPDATHRH